MTDAANSKNPWSDLNVGDTLSGYRLTACLGSGTDSSVFLGRNQSDEDYVLKIGHSLTSETNLLRRLRHHGIARIHDFQQSACFEILVTEWTDGVSLADILPMLADCRSDCDDKGRDEFRDRLDNCRRDRLPSATNVRQQLRSTVGKTHDWPIAFACGTAIELAETLQHIHDNQVAHRDVKPENILLNADGSVTLIDFGISADASTTTAVSSHGGTLAYMAPEQLAALVGIDCEAANDLNRDGATDVAFDDARADIFSLGVTLYELVVGRQPFPLVDGDRPALQIARESLAARLRPPSFSGSPGIPEHLQAILKKCFAPLNADGGRIVRYKSAEELGSDLRDFLIGRPPKFAKTTRLRSTNRLPRLIIGALLLLFTTIAVVTGFDRWQLEDVRKTLRSHDRMDTMDVETRSRIDSVLLRSPGRLETAGQLASRSHLCLRMGILFMDDRQPHVAMTYFIRATKLDHNSGPAWNNLGVARLRTKQPMPAIVAFDRSLNCEVDEAEVLSNRAVAHAMNNDMGRARADLERAMSLDPNSEAVRNNVKLIQSLTDPK